MAYTALYNKYRPRTFEQVAGQQAIVRTLKNAINNGKIAHAYLFCGPRGTGKTSMARLFAKALNCEEGLGHQCNECENCRQLNENSHPDVVEIDAASNNGVEQVRDLIDQVRYSPIKGRMKVYIIDEVHMMSSSAFNALLKTLEEPPNHVVFILATTEPHKVLPTILSRCQRYDFGKISDADMKAKLVWILNEENVHYEEAALEEIVELADGGMRDALSLLDQAIAYGGNELLEKDVLSVFGLASTKEKISLIKMITTGEIEKVIDKLNQFVDSGLDIKRLCSSLLDILKDELIYRKTGNVTYAKSLKIDEAEELSHYVDSERANKLIDLLLKAQVDFRSVSNIRSLFELTLLQMTTLFGGDKKDIVVTPVNPIKENIHYVESPVPAAFPEAKPSQPVVEAKPEPKEEKRVEVTPVEPLVETKEETREVSPAVETKEETIEPVKEEPIKVEPAPTTRRRGYDPEKDGVYEGSVPPSFLFDSEFSENNSNLEEKAVETAPIVEKPIEQPVQKEEAKPEPIPAPKPVEEPLPKPTPRPIPQEAPRPTYEESKPTPTPSIVPTPKPEPVPQPEPAPIKPAPAPKVEPAVIIPDLDTSMIFNAGIASEGTPLNLSDDACISIMVLGSQYKSERKELLAKWAAFEKLAYDPKVGQAATLLTKGRPFCLCREALLINFPFPDQAYRANLRENQRILRQLVGLLLGREVFIHGFDRNDTNRCQNAYFAKFAIQALPSPDSIVLNLPR